MVADTLANNNPFNRRSQSKFALGRVVHNAAPSQDEVRKIVARKAAGQLEPEGEPAKVSVSEQLEQIAEGLGQMFDLMAVIHDQEQSRDKVFDTLYHELHDYKNDFFYERLKPIVKPLLFLMDSLEQYHEELARGQAPTAESVAQNLEHFHHQLADVLDICQVQRMPLPSHEFDAKTQRAVEVLAVTPAEDGKVQRVVRRGYTLNGQMLRPADVVVGKA